MERRTSNKLLIAIATAGILLELLAIALLAAKEISFSVAMPLIIVGMFMAFVPVFVATRRARK